MTQQDFERMSAPSFVLCGIYSQQEPQSLKVLHPEYFSGEKINSEQSRFNTEAFCCTQSWHVDHQRQGYWSAKALTPLSLDWNVIREARNRHLYLEVSTAPPISVHHSFQQWFCRSPILFPNLAVSSSRTP
ncbi:hypothetical protein AGR13a_Lc30081 [Agrobacterium genomosp. 13 str. CFBP 6927]|uniref:Uncharacterized protein n=1 Tax=Agrobacterium genomosp. 13 str. CFBP 6927 TaxID=1183428 RepID=A0ABP2BMR1_9HYPH|nr:hypothetical protein AGR13a_Lc30081 [Agrobacterium genomosp. 13 str. CFBP 6927]